MENHRYKRIVPRAGNEQALAAVAAVFKLREFFEWRGLGSIRITSGVRDAAIVRHARRRAQVRVPEPADRGS